MNKLTAFFLIIFSLFTSMHSSAAGVSKKKNGAKDLTAKCFPADTLKDWEEIYCLQKTGAADAESEAYQPCAKELKTDKSIPHNKCARVIWLKQKSCADNPATGRTRQECLTDKNYLKNISDDPYVGP